MALQPCTCCRRFGLGEVVISPDIPGDLLIVTDLICAYNIGRERHIHMLCVAYTDPNDNFVETSLDPTASPIAHYDNDPDADGG